MSSEQFFNDLAPDMQRLSENFVKGNDQTAMQEFDEKVSNIRSTLAVERQNTENKSEQVSIGNVYDAVSALDRQISVFKQTRSDYFSAQKKEQERLRALYLNKASDGKILKEQGQRNQVRYSDRVPFPGPDGTIQVGE